VINECKRRFLSANVPNNIPRYRLGTYSSVEKSAFGTALTEVRHSSRDEVLLRLEKTTVVLINEEVVDLATDGTFAAISEGVLYERAKYTKDL